MKIFFILSMCFIFLIGCNDNSNNTQNNNEYNTQSLSYTEPKTEEPKIPVEETLSTFSTQITNKYPEKQNNITIACNSLNGIIVKAGETFSFCNTLGPAKPEDGYQKADTFDSDGDTIQEYGGGKCQVSTTIYNAVLAVPSLTVVERHTHSGPVYYVEKGKDACVSYGSVDFKFSNTNDFDIKLYVSNTPDSVDVSIVKISK